MAVLLLIGFVGAVLVLYAAERFLKARRRALRLRSIGDRLDAVTRKAEQQHERREAAAEASAALTSFMPAIKSPPLTVPGTEAKVDVTAESKAAESKGDRERGGRADRGRAVWRRGPRTGEQRVHQAEPSVHTGEQRVRTGEHGVLSAEHPVRSGEHPVRSGEHPVSSGEHPVRSGEHGVRSRAH